jgi:hypothetical protein
MRPFRFLAIAILVVGSLSMPAQGVSDPTLSLGGDASVYLGAFRWKPGALSDSFGPAFFYRGDFFDASVKISGSSDGAFPVDSPYQFGHYMTIDDAVAGLHWKGLSFAGGRGPANDAVDSPYAAFLSSRGNSSVFMDLAWGSPIFAYESRWMRLNRDSLSEYNGSEGAGIRFIDRGMNYKTYELRLGAFTLGFQDAVVYLGHDFDPEFFLSPAPSLISELIDSSAGRPGTQASNVNSLMGFFSRYAQPDWDAYAQFLVDDINAGFMAPVLSWLIPALNDINNLNKFAWSLGGRWRSPYGLFSFHHGGATAYAFESTYTQATGSGGATLAAGPAYSLTPYDYSFYPAVEFLRNGEMAPIPYIDDYIGYKYGENNLAFLLGYANQAFPESSYGFDYSAALEYVVSGSKSPANPWAEHEVWWTITDEPYQLLDESVLEHSLTLTGTASKTWKDWTFTLGIELGYVWNKLALVDTNPGEAKIWKPQQGLGAGVYGLSLGAAYAWKYRESDAAKKAADLEKTKSGPDTPEGE